MWRAYRRAMLACTLFALVVNIALSAGADDRSVRIDSVPQPQSSFDPASVLGFELAKQESAGIPALSSLAFKSAAFGVVSVISVISILLWKIGRPSLSRQPGTHTTLQVSDSLTIAPGISIKALRAGSHQVLVGYDRHGLKGMVLLPDGFDQMLDIAEKELQASADQTATTVGALLGDSSDQDLRWNKNGGVLPRQTLHTNRRADVPMDVGWDLNRLTT